MSRYDDETKRISDRISEIGAEAYQQEVKAQQQGGPYNLRLRGKAWQELTVEGKAELLNGLTTQELESYAFDSREPLKNSPIHRLRV